MDILWEMAMRANPTEFHTLLYRLFSKGILRRVYTQNIDGLEVKAGLQTTNALDPKNPPICIQLHGTITQLRCDKCCSIVNLEGYHHILKNGSFPECGICQENVQKRVKEGRRSTSIPRLRSNILLYEEDHPQDTVIADIVCQDLAVKAQSQFHVDLLLVVGTSLKIPGVTKIIRNFSNIPPGDPSVSSRRAIYINDKISHSTAVNMFDRTLEMDCEAFAREVLKEMRSTSEESIDDDDFNKRRLDLRPSFMWSA
jgi:NAD-dependent SIR2 family protein deacetylase